MMTAKEFHNSKIIPARNELKKLELEYFELYRDECGSKIGERAGCDNCALSCILDITDHNLCIGGKCTCCNSFCYSWVPENNVSRMLRNKYKYDMDLLHGLQTIFGYNFLNECAEPKKEKAVMNLMNMILSFDGKNDMEDA